MTRKRAAAPPEAASTLQLRSRIPHDTPPGPLLDYLARRFRYLERCAWADEIRAGRLAIDGRTADATSTARAGALLVYSRPHREPEVDRRVELLHDDDAIVVVAKPAHLPSHGDGPFVRNTLIHIVRERLRAAELRLVHRLDRETSGVCVLARTEAARAAVAQQFAAGRATKSYLAVARGQPAMRIFTVDRPIGHCTDSAIALRRSAAPDARDAKPARTDFEVLAAGSGRCLLRCEPRTGRTHQIRVHLEAAGHPVLGDKLYGRPDADYLAFVQRVKAGGSPAEVPPDEPGRHLLHAARLSFVHPASGATVDFAAPTPADFATWLADLSPLTDA